MNVLPGLQREQRAELGREQLSEAHLHSRSPLILPTAWAPGKGRVGIIYSCQIWLKPKQGAQILNNK